MNQEVIDCIYAAIDDMNADRGDKPPLVKSPETTLHGTTAALDSLGLINFIVAVEEHLEQRFETSIVLSDDRSLSQEPSPFESVTALAGYVEMLLSERS